MKLDEDFLTMRQPGATHDMKMRIVLLPTTLHDESMANVRFNSLLNVPWLDQIDIQSGAIVVCGNGPSLKDTLPEIRRDVSNGAIVMACNSAANFLITNGVDVDYQVLMDGQSCVVDELAEAKYHLIASVCDPRVFAAVKNPILWHPDIPGIDNYIPAGKSFAYIGGSYTVGNSAVCLAPTLGFKDIHVHGMDSSYTEGQRYADGVHNPNELRVEVEIGDKKYLTSYDLKKQVNAFLLLVDQLEVIGCNLKMCGTGLLQDAYKARLEETCQ